MQSHTIYRNALPTSLEPPAPADGSWVSGWGANDRCVFYYATTPGEEIDEDSNYLLGTLNLSKVAGDVYSPLTEDDVVQLDSASGVNGFIRSIITEVDFGRGLETIEMIQEYGRYVHDMNTGYMEGEMLSVNDALSEAMTGANDNYVPTAKADADFKSVVPLGLQFGKTTKAGQLPFAIDLKACFNSTHLPSNKIKAIQISILWADAFKSGAKCFTNNGAIAFDYKVQNLSMRYVSRPIVKEREVVFKIVDNCSTPYVLNQYSGLSFITSKSCHAVFATFLQNSHNSSSSNLSYNYLQDEALPPLQSLTLKVNGMPDCWQYPLTQTNQILYHYLLALHEGKAPISHSLTYAKLSGALPTGYGIGASLSGEYPANTTITFDVVLDEPLGAGVSYRVFFYSIGFLKV